MYVTAAVPNVEVVTGLRSSSTYVFRLTAETATGQLVGPGQEYKYRTQGAYKALRIWRCA